MPGRDAPPGHSWVRRSRPSQPTGVPPQGRVVRRLLLGLINGAFYALLSLGLAVIFGLMNVINFTHGAQYMMGAFCAWMLLTYLGIPWRAIAPIIVGVTGVIIERLFRVSTTSIIYGLLLARSASRSSSRVCSGVSSCCWGCPTSIPFRRHHGAISS